MPSLSARAQSRRGTESCGLRLIDRQSDIVIGCRLMEKIVSPTPFQGDRNSLGEVAADRLRGRARQIEQVEF